MNNCSDNCPDNLSVPCKKQASNVDRCPEISLIVPNLNEAAVLGRFLNSLAAQEFRDFEVVFVDGGSTDCSLDLLKIFERHNSEISVSKLIDRKRNIGYIRNAGAWAARGKILFHTSSDVVLDPWLLGAVHSAFSDWRLLCLTGRTKPISSQWLSHVAYQAFDLLRFVFSRLPGGMRKFRPGGNFLVIRSDAFWFIRGFPEVSINEDGLLGQKLDLMLLEMAQSYRVKFSLGLCVHHHVKRFKQNGSFKTILFYSYVFANMFPFLKPFFYKIEAHSAEIFRNRSDLRDFSWKS